MIIHIYFVGLRCVLVSCVYTCVRTSRVGRPRRVCAVLVPLSGALIYIYIRGWGVGTDC